MYAISRGPRTLAEPQAVSHDEEVLDLGRAGERDDVEPAVEEVVDQSDQRFLVFG